MRAFVPGRVTIPNRTESKAEERRMIRNKFRKTFHPPSPTQFYLIANNTSVRRFTTLSNDRPARSN